MMFKRSCIGPHYYIRQPKSFDEPVTDIYEGGMNSSILLEIEHHGCASSLLDMIPSSSVKDTSMNTDIPELLDDRKTVQQFKR